ncbi:hypothetical protein AAOE16_02615 [Ekhidna sp. MALMAid0563]|uniref:hypothetical protein n=1 Tax=Ekhidna sp. MALMAid0563 TaxID=3143937 RepID=UPI0032E004BA
MKSPSKILTLIALISFLTSCTSSSSSGENEKSKEELAEEKTIHDLEKLMEDLPDPSLVPFTLKSIGADFDKEHINSLERIESYKSNRDKMALNMGVYASDISYLAAYGHEEDCIDYLRASHGMAEFLGDSAIYNEDDLNEFRGHIANQNEEEIAKILGKLFLETSVKMEEDHHLTMAGLALTGSFVEGLYQAVITIETYPNTPENERLLEPLVKIVLEEEQALLDIIEVLNDLPFDDTIADMITELSILDRLYKGDLQEIEEKMQSDPDFVLTKDVMRDITLEVKRIRERITEE